MQDRVPAVRLRELATKTGTEDVFPALKGRSWRSVDPKAAAVRRELWRAFQRGGLSEVERQRLLVVAQTIGRHTPESTQRRVDAGDHRWQRLIADRQHDPEGTPGQPGA